jgi:hypothetical protein
MIVLRSGLGFIFRESAEVSLLRLDFPFFGFDSVAGDLAVFNDWNAVIGYHHGSRRIHFDFVDSVRIDGYIQTKIATARSAAVPHHFTQISVIGTSTLFGRSVFCHSTLSPIR